MDYINAIMQRAQLKQFGTYILYNGSLTEKGREETEEEASERAYHEFEEQFQKYTGEETCPNSIINALEWYAQAKFNAGFFIGLKAGARVAIQLME